MIDEKTTEIAEILSQLTPENLNRFRDLLKEVEEAVAVGRSDEEIRGIIERHMRECLN